MRRKNGSNHAVARRVAVASLTVLTASGVGLVAAPMAFGQIALPLGGPLLGGQTVGVTNAGAASANSGGNTAVGNKSNNTATASSPTGLISVPISLGGPSNTSNGTAAVTTGPASAVGNASDTTVGQSNASGSQVNSFLGGPTQAAGVANAGSARANSGGNAAVGNGSTNNATVGQNVSGGLIGIGVSLGGPTNNSTGTATINSGSAQAVGNSSDTAIGQTGGVGGGSRGPGGPVALGGPGGGPGGGRSFEGSGPCGSSRFVPLQSANISNRGQAEANSGNNVAVGNASQNNAGTDPGGQTVTGGLLGVGLTIGGPVNNSTGTAAINSGPASAVGNDASTTVAQFDGCAPVATFAGARPSIGVVPGRLPVQTATLARTGLDTGDLGMIAGALLATGMLLVASQRRRMAARSAAVPMAGFGFGMGADEWDGAAR